MTVALSAKGAAYTVTPVDVLWLSRAVEAEGEPRARVASALVNLFMRARARGSKQSLASLVRAYAQPVNPRWYPDGDLHIAAKKAGKDTAEKAARRLAVHSTRTAFAAKTKAAVESALMGAHAHDVTDYAAPHIDGAKKGYAARSEPKPGENRFWSRAPGWTGYAATRLGSTSGVGVWPWAMALALLATWMRR